MKKFCGLLVILGLLGAPALAAYFVAGSFNGWNAAGLAMTETPPGLGHLDRDRDAARPPRGVQDHRRHLGLELPRQR